MTVVNFAFTGAVQTFVVPADVTSLTVDLFGAQGTSFTNSPGGLGGRCQGAITVTPGETLNIYVGGTGALNSTTAGFNGGGLGSAGGSTGGGGGGGTDIRRGGTALSNRVAVAGGGGGAAPAVTTTAYSGGTGGGLTGAAGVTLNGAAGGGGTQSAGGVNSANTTLNGALGVGGNAAAGGGGNAGGGGGFYGGAGGISNNAGDRASGGGGSSLVPSGGTTTSGARTGAGAATLTFNVAPNAPALVAPISGTIDRTVTQRFSWTFSDPDDGDSQSKYDLRYRLVAGTYTTVTGTTPNQFHNFAADTFVAGDFEWSVRTYDALGVVGPYSSSAFFTTGTAPTGPTITAPTNGATISQPTFLVTWSYPTEQAYQLRTVADLAGAPDTTVVYTDTGVVEDGVARSRTVDFPTNGRFEHVQVRVRDAGLFSPYTSVRVMVSYTPPAAPTVVLTTSNAAASIAVAITNPAPGAGQPTVVSHDVYRREGGAGDGIRIATGVVAGGTFTDRTVASGVDYSYRAVAVASNGTTSTSVWVT